MHGLLHMISQKQKKIYPRGKINMRRNSRKSFLCSTFYIKRACEKMRNHLVLLFYRLCFFTAPRAVTCDDLHLRASAHLWHVSVFLCNRAFLGISCYTKIPHLLNFSSNRYGITDFTLQLFQKSHADTGSERITGSVQEYR